MAFAGHVGTPGSPEVFNTTHPNHYQTNVSANVGTITELQIVGLADTTTNARFHTDIIISMNTAGTASILVGSTALPSARLDVAFPAGGGNFNHRFSEPMLAKNPTFLTTSVTATSIAIHGYTGISF